MKNRKPKILTARGSTPSCKLIRDSIEKLTGVHYFISPVGNKVKDVLFRYGNCQPILGKETNFNSPAFIEIAHDKKKFSEFCIKNDFYSPVYHRMDEKPQNYPVIIRTTLTGFKGIGIIVCKNEEEFNKKIRANYWWTDFVHCEFELRVHLFDNKVNRIYKKIHPAVENEFPIRNLDNGYHFALKSNSLEKYPKVLELSEKLGNLFMEIGGHFSALDMGWDKKKKQYFIFEANSAPGLSEINAMEYAKFFVEKLGLEAKNVLE